MRHSILSLFDITLFPHYFAPRSITLFIQVSLYSNYIYNTASCVMIVIFPLHFIHVSLRITFSFNCRLFADPSILLMTLKHLFVSSTGLWVKPLDHITQMLAPYRRLSTNGTPWMPSFDLHLKKAIPTLRLKVASLTIRKFTSLFQSRVPSIFVLFV